MLFHHSDSANPDHASTTIGLFRIVVPPEARAADRPELARAYAINDASGALSALLANNLPKLTLASKKGEAINGGNLLDFLETADANGLRRSSTKFVRVSVFFPISYPENGTIFLIIGREQFNRQEFRPIELERMKEIVSGIQ